MQATVTSTPRQEARREIVRQIKQGVLAKLARVHSAIPMHRTTFYRLLKCVQSKGEEAFTDDQYFGESYQHCSWQRLVPFFKVSGRMTTTEGEVQLEMCAFNNRDLARDVEEVCRNVNTRGATLPDGRRL